MAKISTDAEINAVRLKEQGSDPATPASTYGKLYIKTDGVYFIDDAGVVTGPLGAGGAGGDVVGPASSTDNALARFDGATGKLLQNSNATLSDAGTMNLASGQQYQINGAQHTHDYLPTAAFDGLAKISVAASAPSSPGAGDLWVN